MLNKTKTKVSFPRFFIIDGQAVHVNNKKTIANMFNNFSTNVRIKLANYITVPPIIILKTIYIEKMVYILVSNLFVNLKSTILLIN